MSEVEYMLNHQNKLRAGELRIDAAERFPQFFALHELLGLFPEAVLGVLAVIPAVGDDAVIARQSAGQISGLGRAGDGGEHGLDERGAVALDEGTNRRGMLADEPRGEADDVQDGGALHFTFGVPALAGKVSRIRNANINGRLKDGFSA
jgi:hypothetical protein